MPILLLILIYIALIGLGIPDSLFVVARHSMYQQFNLPLSTANHIIILTSTGPMVPILNSSRLIYRYGTDKLTIASTLQFKHFWVQIIFEYFPQIIEHFPHEFYIAFFSKFKYYLNFSYLVFCGCANQHYFYVLTKEFSTI